MNLNAAVALFLYLCIGVAAFFFTVIYVPPLPDGWFVKLPNWPIAGLVMLFLITFWRENLLHPTGPRIGIAFIVLMLFFGVTIRAAVSDSTGVPWVMFGLFPIQDAADYFGEAADLLTKGVIDTLRGRTIHSAILATLLAVSGFSLYAVALIQTCAAGLSVALAGIAIWRNQGAAAALMTVAVMYAFYHYFVGSMMTETTGFVCGTLAFAMLSEALRLRSQPVFLAGLAVLAFALSVRVGPLFLLPALILWSGFGFRGERRFNFRTPLLGLCVVIAVFSANTALNSRLAPTSGGSFVNAADSIYALVASGKAILGLRTEDELLTQTRWLQIYRDFPELEALSTEARVARKFEIMFDQLLYYPHAIAVGALPEWNNYFFNAQILPYQSSYKNRISRAIVGIFAVIGLFVVCRPKGDIQRGFILASNLGIFASVPFLVGGETRVYAATIGFTAMLPAFGMAFISNQFGKPYLKPEAPKHELAIAYAVAAFASVLIIPIALGAFVYAAAIPSAVAAPECLMGERGFVFRHSPGARRALRQSDDTPLFAAPDLSAAELDERAAGKYAGQHSPAIKALVRYANTSYGSATVHYTLDYVSAKAITFVAPGPGPEMESSFMSGCAAFEEGVWIASTITPYMVDSKKRGKQ